MKLGLKETLAIVALATTGCTSPDLEDNKNETHPVCAVSDVPDAHSDTITWEMVKEIRDKCSRKASNMMVDGGSLGPMIAEKTERGCLWFYGLNPE